MWSWWNLDWSHAHLWSWVTIWWSATQEPLNQAHAYLHSTEGSMLQLHVACYNIPPDHQHWNSLSLSTFIYLQPSCALPWVLTTEWSPTCLVPPVLTALALWPSTPATQGLFSLVVTTPELALGMVRLSLVLSMELTQPAHVSGVTAWSFLLQVNTHLDVNIFYILLQCELLHI